MEIITGEHIDKSFGGTLVFRDMAVTIQQGMVNGLVGKNGSGKTTFIRMLSGLVSPDAGSLRIFDLPMRGRHIRNIKKDISVLGDLNRALYWNISGRENIRYLALIKNGGTSRKVTNYAEELIGYFHMGEYIDRRVETYSKGMKQKLLLLVALVSKPRLLIMDEPMNGLDIKNALLLKSAVRYFVSEEAGTVLITSHDQSLLDEMCDRQLIISDYTIKEYTREAESRKVSVYLAWEPGQSPEGNPNLFPAGAPRAESHGTRLLALDGNVWQLNLSVDEAADFAFLADGIRKRNFRIVGVETGAL